MKKVISKLGAILLSTVLLFSIGFPAEASEAKPFDLKALQSGLKAVSDDYKDGKLYVNRLTPLNNQLIRLNTELAAGTKPTEEKAVKQALTDLDALLVKLDVKKLGVYAKTGDTVKADAAETQTRLDKIRGYLNKSLKTYGLKASAEAPTPEVKQPVKAELSPNVVKYLYTDYEPLRNGTQKIPPEVTKAVAESMSDIDLTQPAYQSYLLNCIGYERGQAEKYGIKMTERELFELSITQLSLPSVVRTGWEMEWKLWLGSEKQPSNQEVIDGLKFSKDEGSILKYKWDPKIGMWVSVLYSAPYGNRDGFYFYVFYLPSGMRLWANTPLEGSRFSEEPPLPK